MFGENMTDFNRETDRMIHFETYISVVMLSTFSLVGTIGNALVLYGFTRARQKYTSAMFICTLATIDLITCVVTIPFTVAMEIVQYEVKHDIICKIYHFLITTTIPFSAFVMVAIAVDRYFCICKPFTKTMTDYRVGMIVTSLGMLSFTLGMLSCLNYGVYTESSNIYSGFFDESNVSLPINASENNLNDNQHETIEWNLWKLFQDINVSRREDLNFDIESLNGLQTPINRGLCHENKMLLGDSFYFVFKDIYSSCYALCAVLVIVIYIVIYRFILRRRQRRLRMESFPCCTFKVPQTNGDSENTEVMYLSQETSVVMDDKSADKNHNAESQRQHLVKQENEDKPNKEKFSLGYQKQERIRRNNIKTAIMLSMVAFIFVVAFLPAWLMNFKVLPFNMIVFHMYFVYNVLNPFIYAFMNPDFQNQLREIFLSLCR